MRESVRTVIRMPEREVGKKGDEGVVLGVGIEIEHGTRPFGLDIELALVSSHTSSSTLRYLLMNKSHENKNKDKRRRGE
jgi:hypothetical protein